MNKNSVTLKDIKSSLTTAKAAQDKDRIITVLFRPISYYLTYLLMRVGFSANKTSLLSFCAGLVSTTSLAFPNIYTKALALVCLYIWQLLEYCDGNIARVSGKTSFAGAVIDNLNPIMIKMLMPIALGINAFLSSDRPFVFKYPLEINLVIGFVASMLYLLSFYYAELSNKIFTAYEGNIKENPIKAKEVSGSSIAKKKKCTVLLKTYRIAEYIESFGYAGLIMTFLFIILNMHLYLLLLLLVVRTIICTASFSRFLYIAVKYSN